jgi:hypothetical protein
MPKRSSTKLTATPKRPKDVNQLAHHLVRLSTEPQDEPTEEQKLSKSDISRVMKEMGRKGGRIGGKRRAERMTPEKRRESASETAKARWGKT